MHDFPPSSPAILLIGASRGIGLAMAAEFLQRGWSVVGTVRGQARTGLHELADAQPDRLAVESVDITQIDQLHALRERLAGRRFEILFVNAGTVNPDPDQTLAELPTEEFVRVMLSNALGPLRALEILDDLVTPAGLLGLMSSGQGSVSNNQQGGRALYRASKAALNMLMRCHAARQAGSPRSLLLLAPGWIRTELGGPDAPFTLEQTVPDIVDRILEQRGKPGLRYLDRLGATVPW
jgi:NAD(P)-dependent dehydrogenase (short-subunit alcohol dehydrogenase family)